MKRFYSYLLVMTMFLLCGGKMMAQSVTIDGVVYSVDGDHAYVSGNSGVGDTVVVLGTVMIDSIEYPVTEIGNQAFYNCSSILHVIISEGITKIGEKAFMYCRNTLSVTLPEGLLSIEREGFYDNYELKTINFPSTLESIGSVAFGYNWDLQVTELPVNLKTLGGNAFRGCQSATFTKIPDGVTYIPEEAFRGCYSLTSLALPKGLTQIDTYAFEGCSALTSIKNSSKLNLQKGSTAHGYVAYYAQQIINVDTIVNDFWFYTDGNGKHHLTYYEGTDTVVTLPTNYEGESYCIGDNAFYGRNEIDTIVLPETVTSIGASAFYNCTSLSSVNIPSAVTTIGDNAFYGCSSLATIDIPTSVSFVGDNAFYGTQIVFPEENGICYVGLTAYSLTDRTLTEYVLKEGTVSIAAGLFSGCSNMTGVDIPSSVVNIGNNAFYNCYALTSVTIPTSVTSMGSYAFYNCQNLKNVNIPTSTEYIGSGAFQYCYALDSVYYNAVNCTSTSSDIFYNCSNLKKITIGDDVKVIPPYLFYDRSSLQTVEIGENVTKIDNQTFYNCYNLKSIHLPNSVDTIGYQAFYYCQNLKHVNIPQSTKYIGDYAFQYCYALDSIYYNAKNCTSSSSNIFSSCSNLKKVTVGNNVKNIPAYLFYDRTSLQTVAIGDSVKKIGDCTFYNCQNLQSINIPNSVDTIGNNVFYNCVSLPIEGNIRYADCYALSVIDKSQTAYTLKENTRFLGTELFRDCANMTSVNIPSGVTAIGDNTFYGCNALTSLTLPETVASIGASAFYNCQALASVNVPSGVVAIHDNTFYNCRALSSLILPETLTSIGASAFYNCSSLASVNIPSGVQGIGNYTFYGCSALTSLTLPETVASIGVYAFYNCSSLASVNIPSGVAAIGDNTFYNCVALTSLSLPETVALIGNSAFYNCSSLLSVNVPSRVTSIGTSAFYNCYSLSSMTIPASVTSIADAAFYGCTGITDLTFVDGGQALSLGRRDYAYGLFKSCPLKRLYLGRDLSYNTSYSYGYSPFYNIGTLTDVTIGDSVTAIGAYSFYDCNALTNLTISTGVTSIGDYAFYSCELLRDFELPETIETIGSYNLDNTYLNIVSHAATPPAINGGCSNKVIYVPSGSGDAYRELYSNNIIIDGEGVTVEVEISDEDTLSIEALKQVDQLSDINHLVVSGVLDDTDISCMKNSMTSLITIDMSGLVMNNIPNSFFKNNKILSRVVLPDSATIVGNEAFRDCSRLKEVVLPDTLQQIGNYAFYQTSLKNVTLPESLTSMGSYVFYNCDNLRSINIPSRVKRLENNLFDDCLLLQSVTFSDSLNYIGTYAFRNCPSLTSVVLPDAITQIETQAFYGCSSLASVTLPQNLLSIGNEAFRGCALESVEMPSSLVSLGTYSFYDCNKLENVTMLSGTSVGEYAFASCDNLKEANLPATLISCGNYIFNGCEQLATVTCRALFPPTLSSIAPNNTCVLYAPEWTFSKYKIVPGWSAFKTIRPISGIYPDDIIVYKEENLALPEEGLPEDYNPNLLVTTNSTAGKLTLRGTIPLTLSLYEMVQTRSTSTMTSLINKVDLSADSVITRMSISTNTWHYLTFPYDVKVSDIVTDGNWIICYYDGEARAKAELDSTWRTVPYDSILHAGEGYIWHSNNSDFTVPAMRNDNRSLIFAKDTRNIQLKEHVASTTANSGWNLIGNPYPCYYDTRFMDFSSPITIRNGNSYAAYSPIDDSYILKPNEAFFVQCSAGNDSIAFAIDGRQTDNSVRSLELSPQRVRKVNGNRRVFNLYLESENFAEHARFVINEEASFAYEFTCDAAKFMSEDATVQQLFIIEGGERLAINERPLANGEITLGTYFGKAGCYTFALDTRATDMEVVLLDKYTGVETDLLTGSYVFNTEVGTFTDRFVIRVKRIGGIADAIEIVPAAEVNVIAQSGAIYITNATAPIYVYNASGALVTTENGNEVTLVVAPGIYIVKVDGEIHKVSVVE